MIYNKSVSVPFILRDFVTFSCEVTAAMYFVNFFLQLLLCLFIVGLQVASKRDAAL